MPPSAGRHKFCGLHQKGDMTLQAIRALYFRALLMIAIAGGIFVLPGTAHAAREILSVTLNGAASVTVLPGAAISATVRVRTTGGGADGRWRSTGWLIGNDIATAVCVDHTNFAGNNTTFNTTFNMTAPAAEGTYPAYFVAYNDDTCSSGDSAIHTMIGAVTVVVPPNVSSISLASTNPTNPNTAVAWTVVFDEPVTGVDAADFALVQAGGVSGATITSVTPSSATSSTTWTVTANTGSGFGTLRLNLVDNDTIVDSGGTPLGGTGTSNGNFVGAAYTVEAPLICVADNFSTGTLDTSFWEVRRIAGNFTPAVVNIGSTGTPDYRLRLTNLDPAGQATFAQIKRVFPAAGNKIVLEIDHFAYGGSGADGIAVTFSDSSISSATGGFGGSLGYAQRTGIDGFGGGWLGIGVDEFGNFPNSTEGRQGYPAGWVRPAGANTNAGFYPNNISIRGSGSGQTGYNLLANTGTGAAVAPTAANSVAGGTPYRYRFTIDHSNNVNAWVTVERDITATGNSYTVVVPRFDVKGANSLQANVPEEFLVSFTGSTGGSNNFHEFKRVSVCANTIETLGPHHLEIEHGSGTGLTCTPSTLTVKACADANVPCTPYTAGVSGTLSKTGTPAVNWDGSSGGAAGAGFSIPAGSSSVTKNVQVTTPGNVVFGATSTPAAIAATTCNFGTPGCTFAAADAGFIVSAPNHVAETTSTLTIQAVRQSDNSLACVPGMTGAKSVNLRCSYLNPASGTLPVRIAGTALAPDSTSACSAGGANVNLTFDASGIATPTLQYADVGQMQINASFTGTAGTIDEGLSLIGAGSFIAAPASFAFSGITPAPIKAGAAFAATVTAMNTAGAATRNFGKEAAAEGVTLSSNLILPNPALAAGGANPGLSNNTIPGASFINGVATVNNLRWNEVGVITMTANLSSGNYLSSGVAAATGTSGNVGRFIPDYFDTIVSGGMPCPTGLTCPATFNGFVYSGQPFTTTVLARNQAGGTTLNYDGSRLRSNDVTLSAWNARGGASANPNGGVLASNSVPASAFVLGQAVTATPAYLLPNAYPSATSPPGPTDIYIRAIDTDGVSSLRGASSIEGGIKVVSGRILLPNVHGSELLKLTVPVSVQYWNGTRYVTSTTDNTTVIGPGNVGFTNCKNALATSGPAPSNCNALVSTVSLPSPILLAAGVGSFRLNAPGPGNNGSADMTFTAPSYLPGVTGRVSFGINKSQFIYLREMH